MTMLCLECCHWCTVPGALLEGGIILALLLFSQLETPLPASLLGFAVGVVYEVLGPFRVRQLRIAENLLRTLYHILEDGD